MGFFLYFSTLLLAPSGLSFHPPTSELAVLYTVAVVHLAQ